MCFSFFSNLIFSRHRFNQWKRRMRSKIELKMIILLDVAMRANIVTLAVVLFIIFSFSVIFFCSFCYEFYYSNHCTLHVFLKRRFSSQFHRFIHELLLFFCFLVCCLFNVYSNKLVWNRANYSSIRLSYINPLSFSVFLERLEF